MTRPSNMASVDNHVEVAATAVFLVAIVIRLLFLAWGGVRHDGGDTLGYKTIARNLNEHGAFSLSDSFPYTPTIRRPPLYPFFLAVVGSGVGGFLMQVFLDSASAVGVYFLARSAARPSLALGAGLYYAVYPGAIVASCVLLSETLFIATLVATAALLARSMQGSKAWASIGGGVCLGLAILCRPIAGVYLIAPLAALIIAPAIPRGCRHSIMLLCRHSILLLVGTVLVTAPWLVRCYTVSGRFVFVQGAAAVSWYVPTRADLDQANEEKLWPQFGQDPYGARLAASRTPADMAEADRFGFAQALRNVRRSPVAYIRSRLAAYPHLVITSFDSITGINRSFAALTDDRDVLCIAVKLAMMSVFSLAPIIFGVVGLTSIWRNPVSMLCAFIWVATLAIHVPMWIEPRFWLPAVPFLLVSGACGVGTLCERFRHTPASV